MMIAAMGCTSCKKDNGVIDPDEPDVPGGTTTVLFKIKQATITYDMVDGEVKKTMIFDDNGKKFRLEEAVYTYILDEAANKAYKLQKSTKTYEEVTVSSVQIERKTFIMAINDANFATAGYTKSSQTVAGKTCSVYSGKAGTTTVVFGGWNDIVFLAKTNSITAIEAKTISETAAAGSFTVPSDYTKK